MNTYATRRRTEDPSGFEVLFIFMLIPLSCIYFGWVTKTIWNWFVPEITGWQRLGIAQAIGLSCLVGIWRNSKVASSKNETRIERWTTIIGGWIGLILTLGIAWIVHSFVA